MPASTLVVHLGLGGGSQPFAMELMEVYHRQVAEKSYNAENGRRGTWLALFLGTQGLTRTHFLLHLKQGGHHGRVHIRIFHG